ncbi:hypothetical protein RS030_142092 [Cryptosporidium xiaoi]|uniref:Uncharacterized protein n=1 Tax=Cryptosporidium xiaoi TaxID=659607 RepID=A0AAV9Y183_9CRYT
MGQVLNCECCTEHSKCTVDQCEVEIVYPKCNYIELQRKMGYVPISTSSPMSSRNQTPRSVLSHYPSPRFKG